MKNKDSLSGWDAEYRFFMESPRTDPPATVSAHVVGQVTRELAPSFQLVFAKLFVIHFISSVATLLFCPQLGFALHGNSEALLGVFLQLGEYGCMWACGGLFVGATALVAAVALSPAEVRAIRGSRGLQWILLTLVSAGFFLSFREQESTIPFGLVIAWFVGAMTGGVSVFRVVGWLRTRFHVYRLMPR